MKGRDAVYMSKPMTCEAKRGGLPGVSAHVNAEIAMAEAHLANMCAPKTRPVKTAEAAKTMKAAVKAAVKTVVKTAMKASEPPGIYCCCRHLDKQCRENYESSTPAHSNPPHRGTGTRAISSTRRRTPRRTPWGKLGKLKDRCGHTCYSPDG